MVSAEEIAFVIQHVLTAASTAEEAKAIAEEVWFVGLIGYIRRSAGSIICSTVAWHS